MSCAHDEVGKVNSIKILTAQSLVTASRSWFSSQTITCAPLTRLPGPVAALSHRNPSRWNSIPTLVSCPCSPQIEGSAGLRKTASPARARGSPSGASSRRRPAGRGAGPRSGCRCTRSTRDSARCGCRHPEQQRLEQGAALCARFDIDSTTQVGRNRVADASSALAMPARRLPVRSSVAFHRPNSSADGRPRPGTGKVARNSVAVAGGRRIG